MQRLTFHVKGNVKNYFIRTESFTVYRNTHIL